MEPAPPDLPPDLAPLADPGAPADGGLWALGVVADLAAPGSRARDLTLDAVRVDGADLTGSRLDGLRVVDSVLVRCDLSTLAARGASLNRAALSGCRGTGMRVTEGALRDVSFTDCALDLASFAGSTLEHVRFTGCVLREAVFADARLQVVSFEDCDLSGADLTGARLEAVGLRGCDLTGADLTGARFRHSELRGCTLERARGLADLRGVRMPRSDMIAAAADLAAALGIVELRE